MIQASGTAVIQHRDSGKIYEIDAGELQLEAVSSHDRDMGPEVLWSARIDHAELGELEWSIAEYPIGAISGTPDHDVNGHELQSDFHFEIDYERPEPDFDESDEDEDSPVSLPTSITDGDLEEMRDWFHAHYEDPTDSLPYSTRDGGFQWINGGPFVPIEVLQEEFDSVYSFEAIEAAAQAIIDENGIYDWTSKEDSESSDERVLRFAARLDRHLPLAERIVFNNETGSFNMVATLAAKPDLLKATLSQIEDALDDCLATQSNGLSEQDHEVRKIRRMLSKYADDPQRIEMDATSVRNSILSKIGTEELPRSEEIQDLLNALQDAAQGIRATDANIAENRRILQSNSMRPLSPEDVQAIKQAAPILEEITEGDLKEQIKDDLSILAEYDGYLGGVTRSDGFGHDEVNRVMGRTARMLLAIKKTLQFTKKMVGRAYSLAQTTASLYGIIEVGVKIFQFLFG
ncbi:hypothetical protein J3U99_22425 [Brucella pituitosa]|uniref:hypothetical protein n=1 Tax=Brucella pituitosa TaxID=571256 RepID=UPI002006430C|nr:hypothetical protein [Brucella pituitosa]MCK4207517.1 hypothetical protein [Brucella pituitosa]